MIQRLMARYLQRKGWICFWLDRESQYCSGYDNKNVCWLKEFIR